MVARLGRHDWLAAGLKSLAENGHGSLRAERLAQSMKVSRGSFYWHFSDVSAFEEAVLCEWEVVAVETPYARATANESRDRAEALAALISRAFRGSDALERAVRTWSGVSPTAAAALARVDRRRITLLTKLMPPSTTARAQAITLYWTYIGHVTAPEPHVDDAIMSVLMERFCPLRPPTS